jgi:hypothetical protein
MIDRGPELFERLNLPRELRSVVSAKPEDVAAARDAAASLLEQQLADVRATLDSLGGLPAPVDASAHDAEALAAEAEAAAEAAEAAVNAAGGSTLSSVPTRLPSTTKNTRKGLGWRRVGQRTAP